MKRKHVIGIDLGTRKSGVCWIAGNELAFLSTIETLNLVDSLAEIEAEQDVPTVVVVDAPIDPTDGGGFRDIDRVFMRGLFNNNHIGLQPNNPDLLNMANEVAALAGWCNERGIEYSNDFPSESEKVLRETMPNPALGILSAPETLMPVKQRLRFRYGRGKNVPPIVVAFESLQGGAISLFEHLEGAPMNWDTLEQLPQNLRIEQSDDLIAALVCGSLAWWQANTNEVGFVTEDRGHYLLPPLRLIHADWSDEICRILGDDDFADVETNLCPARQVQEGQE